MNSVILNTDAYKLSHFAAYPKGISGMFSYLASRATGEQVVAFGLQAWLRKLLTRPVTVEDVNEAEEFCKATFMPFNRDAWMKVVNVYGGRLPLTIRAVPEGTVVPAGVPIVTVECTDPDLFWLASYIETDLLRGIWYPTTIASNDRKAWRILKFYLNATADSTDLLPFMLNDFGARGVSSEETADVGGMAHMVYFKGSDTLTGILAAKRYYGGILPALVPAAEHSIQCSFGPLDQRTYLHTMLDEYAKPGGIVSIVLDGYDVYREAEILCSEEFVSKVKASGARVVFRPDSGDALEVIPRILRMQESGYGYTVNSRGYKVINNVGIIQGDGIDLESMEAILKCITDLGYSAANIVFGSGGGLLQKVNRDTYKFAQKASAITYSTGDQKKWEPIFKDPVTDPGKTSLKGRVTAVRWKLTGAIQYADMDRALDVEFADIMETVYGFNGSAYDILVITTLDEVSQRATSC